MDEAVRRALERWPDVPDCYGWLRLDARGRWWVADATGRFDLIRHDGLVSFIGRNYQADERGRWFFQNGPQRVWVACEYTPHVYRLSDDMTRLVSHAAAAEAGEPRRLIVDDQGALLIDCDPGPGLILDRDLAGVVDLLCDIDGAAIDPAALLGGELKSVRLFGLEVAVFPEKREHMPQVLGYDPAPEAPVEAPPSIS
jgi:hypothetical protein